MTARATALATLLTAAALAAGCGDDDEADPGRPAAASIDVACAATSDPLPHDRVAGLPGYPPDGVAALAHARATYRPGQRIALLPVNRADGPVRYGMPFELERRDGSRWSPVPLPEDLVFTMQIETAVPGRTGRCAGAIVPRDASDGRYRVTLTGSRPPLRAEFAVAGEPLPAAEDVPPATTTRPEAGEPPAATTERGSGVPRLDDPSGTGPDAPEPGLQSIR